MYPYPDESAALTDALRLAKGMTLKSAISGLPLGGGKSVIIGDPQRDKTPELMAAFGRCLESLAGRYIVAEDSGTSVDDIRVIASQTQYISGLGERPMPDGGVADGDPSPATAYGVFKGIQATVEHVWQRDDLRGLKVLVQGVGSVGRRLVKHLLDAGAEVLVADVYQDRVGELLNSYAVTKVSANEVYSAEVDIFSPCALGAILNDQSIGQLQAKVIAGAANNQLAEPRHVKALAEKGIVYVPDFAINAGGVIDIAGYQAGLSYSESMQQVAGIYETVGTILQFAQRKQQTTLAIAEEMALQQLKN